MTTVSPPQRSSEDRVDALLSDIQSRLERLEQDRQQPAPDADALNLVVFEAHRDRLLSAFVMATGAAACGMKVKMFFTFWATSALRSESAKRRSKTFVERAFGWMLPRSLGRTRLSQLDMGGMGRFMMQREMKKKNIADLPQLLETAAELGVVIQVCEMSMRLMGIHESELIDYPGLKFCGVAQLVDDAANANTTLFI